MDIGQRISKIAVTGMLTILALIMVMSLGMPNFLQSSIQGERLVAGRVNGEMITTLAVNTQVNSQIRKYYKGRPASNALKVQMREQVLEGLIRNRIVYNVFEDFELTPSNSRRKEILATKLRSQFPSYISKKTDRFLTRKFQREMLEPNNYTYVKLENEFVKQETFTEGDKFLKKLRIGSKFDAIEKMRLQQTKLSYQIVVINDSAYRKTLEAKSYVTNAEIQKDFETKHKKKNKKLTLTKSLRKSIESQLKSAKTTKAMTKWRDELAKLVANNTALYLLAIQNGGKLVTLNDVALSDTLASKKKKQDPPLNFENDKKFEQALFSAKINTNVGLMQNGGYTYVFRITKRDISTLPSSKKIIEDKLKMEDVLKDKLVFLDTTMDSLKEKHYNGLYSGFYEVAKNNTKIERNSSFISVANPANQR